MEGLFNAMPKELRNMQVVSLKTFKDRWNEWLRTIPHTPKLDRIKNQYDAKHCEQIDSWEVGQKSTFVVQSCGSKMV